MNKQKAGDQFAQHEATAAVSVTTAQAGLQAALDRVLLAGQAWGLKVAWEAIVAGSDLFGDDVLNAYRAGFETLPVKTRDRVRLLGMPPLGEGNGSPPSPADEGDDSP